MVICSSTLTGYDALWNDAISHKCMHKFTTATGGVADRYVQECRVEDAKIPNDICIVIHIQT